MNSWTEYYKLKIQKVGFLEYYNSKIGKNKSFLAIVERYGEKTKKLVMESGIGTSFFLVYLNKKGFECAGIDKEKGIIEFGKFIAKKFKVKIHFYLQDLMKTNFAEKTFGVSFNLGVMEHFLDKEIIRAIREQTRIADYYIFAIPSENVLRPNSEYFGDERYLSARTWEDLITKAGAKLELKAGYRFEHKRFFSLLYNLFNVYYHKATFFVYVVKRREI